MNPDNAIELRGVNLVYSYDICTEEKKGFFNKKQKNKMKNHVLDGLNLDVKKGEILGIIGTNGSGKSTLLSIIAKILEPDSGSVRVCGKVATILELGMGFHGDLTGRENIILKGELYGFSKKEMESKVDEIIEYSGIRCYIDNPLRTYSSGMRSRLAFSIMIHVDANIMLVDEILSTGDHTFSIKASDFFKKTLKDGKTVVYVSHSPGSIESICTRAIWLDKGKIVADGKPKKVCAQYRNASLESFDVINDQAMSGLSNSQYLLGMLYKNGNGVEQNLKKYLEWIKLAAEQSHSKAQVELADYLMNRDSEDDYDVAMTYYRSAAAKGDPIARSRLSSIIGKENVRHDYEQVKHIFEYFAKNGSPIAMYRYANFLLKMAWDDNDRHEAFTWFKKVAEDFNHPDAIMQISAMYRDGIGVKKNKGLYIDTLKKGSALGIVKAMIQLAELYSTGVLVEEDQKKALELYEECANRGVASCQYTVATMYSEGIGVEPNKEKSEYWFSTYAKSQLSPYQALAFNILRNNDVPGSIGVDALYDEINDTKDSKIIMELCDYTISNPLLSNTEKANRLSQYYLSLSKIYGKSMNVAFEYYSDIKSIGYDPSMAIEIGKKLLYLGDKNIIFKTAICCIHNGDNKDIEFGNKCLKYLAKKGHRDAINYCIANMVDYN